MLLRHARVRFALDPLWCRHAHTTRYAVEDSRWPGWSVVVGIEVHAQIKSRRKLFSESWTSDLTDPSNTRVSSYDAAFPGMLPHLNPKCVELGVRAAIALNAEVQRKSAFDRKHYFYADLPSGYQITQQYAPFAKNGRLSLADDAVSVRIKQIQLEQDTGKSISDPRRRVTSIDLNRAGTGLMEIVSEPDMRSPEEAGEYVRTLQSLLRAVGSSDGNMEQGSLRCDVNVSVNRLGDALGTRCEIKNLNSVRFLMIAITSEVRRQIGLLESGQPVAQETRGFDEDRAETYSLRSKEDAPDYRYMPDPNLPPLLLDKTYVENIRKRMPELPDATRTRLLGLGLSRRDVNALMDVDEMCREVDYDGGVGKGAVAYFDAVSQGRNSKVAHNWIMNQVLGQLANQQQTFKENPVSVEQMRDLIDLVESGKVTGTSAKTLLRTMLAKPSDQLPSKLAEEMFLIAVHDDVVQLEKWCADTVAALPREAEAVRQGNPNVLNKIVGRVMKLSNGRADAKAAREMLTKILQ